MTHREVRDLLGAASPRRLRESAGIRVATIAVALGVSRTSVREWETGRGAPSGTVAFRYARVIQGLARHAEIRREY